MIVDKNLPECPVATTVGLIGNKWKILIIRNRLNGTFRFGELRKGIDKISQKVLTDNLRELESDGLIIRKIYAEVPPRVEYSLSPLGNSLKPIINDMAVWGNTYKELMINSSDQ